MLKILIVVDMQNDFINGSLGTKEAMSIIDNVVQKIGAYRDDCYNKIIVTMDTHHRNYLETPEGKNLPVPHCIKLTNGWLINEKVFNAVSESEPLVLEKETFASTDLIDVIEKYLETRYSSNIEIEIVGLCTDICVISNALLLKAYFPKLNITVDASCCAGTTPENHNAALTVMKMCHINVIGE